MTVRASYDQFFELLKSRHSCRGFLSDPVATETIEAIVMAAQRVPSWCNAQPWQLVITRKAETDRLRRNLMAAFAKGRAAGPDLGFPKRYKGIYQERRRECGWQLYEAVGVERGDRAASAREMAENFRLFGAPHVAIVTTEADLGAYGVLDCGAFMTAFTLAAASLGIATIPQAAVAGFSDLLRERYDIAPTRQILCGISFGYIDRDHPANGFRTSRASPGEVIEWR
ncbi:MAG: nitroreductase [Paracoccaceae bacterium]